MKFAKNEKLCSLLALAGVLSLCSCMEQIAPDATTSSLVSLDNAAESDARMLDVSSDTSLPEVVEEVPSDVLIAEYKQLRASGCLPLLSPSDRYQEYDAVRELRDFALYDNISEMSKAGMTYSIRSVGRHVYLTSSQLNKILTFQRWNDGSSSQKFEIRTHPLTSGMEYTIHSTGAYVGIMGEGVLKSGSSTLHYATLFPMKEIGMNYMAKNWKLVVDLDGRFKIINPDAIFFPMSQTSRLRASEYRLLEVGSNNRGEFNSEVSDDSPRSRNQLFNIEPNKPFEIRGVEYLDERDHLSGKVSEVRPQGSTTVECSYTNPTSVYREQTVTFESVDLEENSNYDEYTDFKYIISNVDDSRLDTPEVFDGSLQKKPSVNAPKLSRYKERQTIYRSLKDIAFRVEIPAKSRVTVRYSIPKYYVRCPYKLTLALKDDSNVRVAVYGYWSGDVHSMADAEDPEIIVETSSGTKKTYRLPISLIESGRTIKTSMLQQL